MGNSNSTVIEINGQKYDARSGKLIGEQSTSSRNQSSGKSIDGVARNVKHSRDVHSRTSRSKTLMRHVVKKPQHAKSVTPDEIKRLHSPKSETPTSVTQQKSFYQSDKKRLKRAESIKQNALVRKFSDIGSPSTTSTVVNHAPVQKMAVAPAPAHATMQTLSSSSKKNTVIERGLKNAQSHNQTHHKAKKPKRKTKIASLAAASMAVFLLVGFFGYQYAPNVSMRYASARSGVDATMPGYNPSGFALNNNIHYTPGQVTLTFRSNSDERQFNIVQRESTWNSETLRANYVANIDKTMQTYEDKGRTIYIYGESNATWVDGGVWYDIQGNSQLNSDQLIRIANSM